VASQCQPSSVRSRRPSGARGHGRSPSMPPSCSWPLPHYRFTNMWVSMLTVQLICATLVVRRTDWVEQAAGAHELAGVGPTGSSYASSRVGSSSPHQSHPSPLASRCLTSWWCVRFWRGRGGGSEASPQHWSSMGKFVVLRCSCHQACRGPFAGGCVPCVPLDWCWVAGWATDVWLGYRHLVVAPCWATGQLASGVEALLGWCAGWCEVLVLVLVEVWSV
jgi:hypothetical protein